MAIRKLRKEKTETSFFCGYILETCIEIWLFKKVFLNFGDLFSKIQLNLQQKVSKSLDFCKILHPKKNVAPYMHLDIWIAHFCKNFKFFIHLKYISLVSSWNYTMVLLSSYEMLQINVFVCIINFWLFLCCNLQPITSSKWLHVNSNDYYSSFIKAVLGTIVLDSISYSSSLLFRQFQT